MVDNNLYVYDFYTLRIPTFPFEKLIQINATLERISQKKVLSNSDAHELRHVFSDNSFNEGLFFASPILFAETQKWLQGGLYSFEETIKLLLALHKYYTRMCSRCTPFGTFAGTATGSITKKATEFEFEENKFKRAIDFDIGILSNVVETIVRDPKMRREVKFRANDTIYRVGNKYIFTESVSTNGISENVLSSISQSPYITKVLSISRTLRNFNDLVEAVISENPTFEIARVEQFIGDLISSQVLISELSLQVTGADKFVEKLIEVVSGLGDNAKKFSFLKIIAAELKGEDISLKNMIVFDKTIRDGIPLWHEKETLRETLSFKTTKNTIKADVIEEIAKLSEKLWNTQSPVNSVDLESFKRRFENKFGGQAIPLLIALDTEVGVGYSSAVNGTTEYMPLLKDISVKVVDNSTPENLSRLYRIVKSVMKTFYKTGNHVIEIDEGEISNFLSERDDQKTLTTQNSSKFIFGSIISESSKAIDRGEYKFLAKHLFNYSAGRMLGRFANQDPVLKDKLKRLILDEEIVNDKFILAEVLHNPGGHVSNVVMRPDFRKYEVPINCQPSVNDNHVIYLDDLSISIENERVILRSRNLNKEVLPQITNAYNVHRAEPLLRFLSDIQNQYTQSFFSWDWYDYYDEEYLPRVEFKKIILTRARWNIKKIKSHLDSIDLFKDYIGEISDRLNIPRYVCLVQNFDNELCLDLRNTFCLRHLQKHLKHNDAILFEFLQTQDNCFIHDKDGSYCNEIIIPFGANQPAYPAQYSIVSNGRHNVKVKFPPSDEWLFLKIYAGNKTLDHLLTDKLAPFCHVLVRDGYIDKWFYIRYNDPERHLRLRLHVKHPGESFAVILLKLNMIVAPYLADNRISSLLLDTYVREIERYTPTFIENSEQLFFLDSIAVSSFLTKIEGDEGEENRWLGALYSIDLLLSDFDFALSEKKEIMQELGDTFLYEFITSQSDMKALNYSLNRKYREKCSSIINLLTGNMSAEAIEIFMDFQKRSRSNMEIIKTMALSPHFTIKTKISLVKSYIHMNLNRVFLSRARNHEMVVYHLLKKFYTSAIKAKNQIL